MAFPQALIVLGGGQTPECTLPSMVSSRFDAALADWADIVTKSGGRFESRSPEAFVLSSGLIFFACAFIYM